MNTIPPPQPNPDPDSRGYWEHTARGVVALQRCAACRRYQFPALETCRHCGGTLAWEPVSGRGRVHAYIVQQHPVAPGYDDLRPYAIALVEPEESPDLHVPGRVLGPPGAVRVGAAVQAEIIDLPGGSYRVPVYRLTGG
ncbi:MAG: Zn-ribbon domain-containing OB-fold protein [Gammaproteobacteria bacterium]